MKKPLCLSCSRPKATLNCGLCASAVCKSCALFVDENDFSFLKTIPKELTHSVYCGPCYDEKVAPRRAWYDQTMENAKEVLVFFKDQGKESRAFDRTAPVVEVDDCADRDETVLRLAFLAAQGKFNAIIDVDLNSVKIRNAGYQTMKWKGKAVPTQIDLDKLKRKVEFQYRRNS